MALRVVTKAVVYLKIFTPAAITKQEIMPYIIK